MTHHTNIPIEIMKTVLTVADEGSISKAAKILQLSQPAVSSQIKRIERMVGGLVFRKTANGSALTELGKTVVKQARLMVEANQQIFALGGAIPGQLRQIRLGLSSLLVRRFVLERTPEMLLNIHIQSGQSAEIARLLLDGQLDIAAFYNTKPSPEILPFVVAEFREPTVWVRAKTFSIQPGSPVPIITWSGDDWIARAFSHAGLSFRIVFNGYDNDAKRSVVESGMGIAALPKSLVPKNLIQVEGPYLPKLPMIATVLCIRPGLNFDAVASLQNQLLQTLFRQP